MIAPKESGTCGDVKAMLLKEARERTKCLTVRGKTIENEKEGRKASSVNHPSMGEEGTLNVSLCVCLIFQGVRVKSRQGIV